MKITKKLLLITAIVLGVILASVGVSYAISNGERDGDGHPYVGAVHNFQFGCSGSAISPYVFVTAAHCFGYSGEPVLVTFHPDGFNAADPQYISGTWYPHPDFCLGCGNGLPGVDSHDVAVVILDEAVDLPRYAELPAPGLVDTLPMNTPLTLVGYGRQFDSGGGPRFPPDAMWYRNVGYSELIASNHVHSDEYIKLSGNSGQGGGTCFGDSGGPNLLGDTDTILAVTSYGTNGNCAGVGYSNRIDTYALDFINDFLE